MINKELRRLNRKQLLELLLVQTERVEALEKELADTKALLQDRKINEDEAGSIAEASLRINGVFEAAEKAAAQYLENVRIKAEGGEAQLLKYESAEALTAEELIANTERICREREALCQERLDHINKLINERYSEYRKLNAVYEESMNTVPDEDEED